jgi:hypothetical protein
VPATEQFVGELGLGHLQGLFSRRKYTGSALAASRPEKQMRPFMAAGMPLAQVG